VHMLTIFDGRFKTIFLMRKKSKVSDAKHVIFSLSLPLGLLLSVLLLLLSKVNDIQGDQN
jgi:hypothetical protein